MLVVKRQLPLYFNHAGENPVKLFLHYTNTYYVMQLILILLFIQFGRELIINFGGDDLPYEVATTRDLRYSAY